MPLLLISIVCEQHVLRSALSDVIKDRTVNISPNDARAYFSDWQTIYKWVNLGGQAFALVVGVISIILCRESMISNAGKTWEVDSNGQFYIGGWAFLFGISAFYMVATIFVCRCICTSCLLTSLTRRKTITMKIAPFHPDRSGGLGSIGDIGLRNQYAVSVIGMNVFLFLVVIRWEDPSSPWLWTLFAIVALAYVVLAPMIFLGPLIPFHRKMSESKKEMALPISRQLEGHLRGIVGPSRSHVMTKDDRESIQRLRSLAKLVADIPVWPFDSTTLRKYLGAYVAPMIFSVAPVLVGLIV